MLDAANVVAQRRGDAFMDAFGAAMTGVAPKTAFLKPSVALPLAAEMLRQLASRRGETVERYAEGVHASPQRETSFYQGCLLDSSLLTGTGA
jgi:hypothetical protein